MSIVRASTSTIKYASHSRSADKQFRRSPTFRDLDHETLNFCDLRQIFIYNKSRAAQDIDFFATLHIITQWLKERYVDSTATRASPSRTEALCLTCPSRNPQRARRSSKVPRKARARSLRRYDLPPVDVFFHDSIIHQRRSPHPTTTPPHHLQPKTTHQLTRRTVHNQLFAASL